ncbi:MAG: hypothetical protein ACYTG0_21740 [Planctomycetota bacterium]|jgi:hypothetical protein
MELELLNTSVVVLAHEHNPTILHPEFLLARAIVSEDWEVADPPITTPAFSVAKYNNGITFQVDSKRFIITEEKPAGNPGQSRIPDLAIGYVEALPHVRYKALGVNFKGYCLRKDPEQFLIERFLKTGPWNDETRPMRAYGSRFVYHVEDTVIGMGFDGGQVNQEGKSEPAVLINVNFHSDLPDRDQVEALRELVSHWADRLSYFTNLTRVIFGMEESE